MCRRDARARCPHPSARHWRAKLCASRRAALMPVALDRWRRPTSSSRAASPGCGVASVGALRAATAARNAGSARDQVERVGIERDRESAARARAQQRARGVARCQGRGRTTSASGSRLEHGAGVPQHQFRHAGIELRRVAPSGSRARLCPRRRGSAARPARMSGAAHPFACRRGFPACRRFPCCTLRARQRQHRRQRRRERRPVEPVPTRSRRRVDAQRDARSTCRSKSGPSPVSRPGLQRDERCGGRGANGRRRAHVRCRRRGRSECRARVSARRCALAHSTSAA